jgi:hypothetical protein
MCSLIFDLFHELLYVVILRNVPFSARATCKYLKLKEGAKRSAPDVNHIAAAYFWKVNLQNLLQTNKLPIIEPLCEFDNDSMILEVRFASEASGRTSTTLRVPLSGWLREVAAWKLVVEADATRGLRSWTVPESGIPVHGPAAFRRGGFHRAAQLPFTANPSLCSGV